MSANDPAPIGQERTLRIGWTDQKTGGLVSPPTTCKVRPPAGPEVVVPVTLATDGAWEGKYTPLVAGPHWYGFTAAGSFGGVTYKGFAESVFQASAQRS